MKKKDFFKDKLETILTKTELFSIRGGEGEDDDGVIEPTSTKIEAS